MHFPQKKFFCKLNLVCFTKENFRSQSAHYMYQASEKQNERSCVVQTLNKDCKSLFKFTYPLEIACYVQADFSAQTQDAIRFPSGERDEVGGGVTKLMYR